VAVSARREVVRQLQGIGLSERQTLRLVGMSASTLRYEPRDDGNEGLRERLKELAGQHRRHGYRMLHSRLRIDGWTINVKRTYRVYREEGLMVRKRRRKKLPVPERQPLVRPTQANEVWSMDFVFDELANGRRVKTLTVVDDCSKEAVQIAVDTSIPALYVTRVLDQVKAERGLPKVIRTDNGPEFAGRTNRRRVPAETAPCCQSAPSAERVRAGWSSATAPHELPRLGVGPQCGGTHRRRHRGACTPSGSLPGSARGLVMSGALTIAPWRGMLHFSIPRMDILLVAIGLQLAVAAALGWVLQRRRPHLGTFTPDLPAGVRTA